MVIQYFLFTLLLSIEVENSEILGVFWTPSRSHHILGSALLQALAKKGHNVTLLTPYIDDVNITNFEQVELEGIAGSFSGLAIPNTSIFQQIKLIFSMYEESSEKFWKNTAVQNLIQSRRKYDVVISINAMMYDGTLALNHHIGAPTILFGPGGTSGLVNKYVANPNLPYSINLHFSKGMPNTFFGRLYSITMMSMLSLMENYFFHPTSEKIMRKYLPNSPPLREIQKNVAMVLVNSHHSIEAPRPYVPNLVQIGGFYAQTAKKLPDDLQNFLDSAEKGAVLFCFGTNLKIESIDKQKLDAILKGLGKVDPVKVLFKSEIDLPNLPQNILVKKWLPQNDVLAHPNIRAFVTHGGLGGITEAIFHGIPILGIPFFSDQKSNIATASDAGYASQLSYDDITLESFEEALLELLRNTKYSREAKKRSKILRNQPIKPLDKAIWWVEHIIEFKCGDHLRNKGMDFEWYQLYMVDIAIFYFFIFSTICSFFILAMIYMCRKIAKKCEIGSKKLR